MRPKYWAHLAARSHRGNICRQAWTFLRKPYTTGAQQTIPEPGTESHGQLQDSLPGTVQSHRCHVFLESPIRPTEFGERHTTPVQRALLLRFLRMGVIVTPAWHDSGSGERQSAVAYSSLGGRLDISDVTLDNIDLVEQQLKDHIAGPLTQATSSQVDLYVCTHANRDCRCGTMGGLVAEALREEIKRLQKTNPSSTPRIRIGEVAHVGGHKYAANVLVYPQGEWLGLVRPEDAPRVISSVIALPARPLDPFDPILLKPHWRGRMGLGKDEQVDLFQAQATD
ncbi:hypothetical protein FA15DRAFT_593482 [Coprinopsis marcescibilis]|uniref:Sucraseferredoxin-like protein n=1 Tax=Coprinopsis marcescibilis TaxID=230819 RepID=A0A5C3KTR7_COPMA|nr:hypothetical protein FA15DRAFT_593482 [Coprinopsis marcescibilis]